VWLIRDDCGACRDLPANCSILAFFAAGIWGSELGLREVLRLAELLGALSLTTDLGAGVPFEKGLRTCVVASLVADELELGATDRAAVYFASLLRSLGCTAHGSTFAEWFDDDVVIQRELKMLDLGDPAWSARQAARFATWAGPERASVLAARFATTVPAHGAELARGSCEVSATLGAQLGLPGGAVEALDEVYERYDGNGFPAGRAGGALTIAARVVHVAERAVMAHDGGVAAAVREVQRHAGGQLDPDVCLGFVAHSEAIFSALGTDDVLAAALAREPAPHRKVSAAEIDRVCGAFATFADLKGRFLLGHSTHVAALSERAAELAGCEAEARAAIRTSALLLDIGRVGISSGIWDRPGPLGQVEWERVRLHP
jgi:hypothetical protein